MKENSGNGQLSPWVPPLGNLDGGCLPGLFSETDEGKFWKLATLSMGAPVGETWTGFLNMDFLERQINESSGNGKLSPWVPTLGKLDEVRLLGRF
jgi:hypothetical protein